MLRIDIISLSSIGILSHWILCSMVFEWHSRIKFSYAIALWTDCRSQTIVGYNRLDFKNGCYLISVHPAPFHLIPPIKIYPCSKSWHLYIFIKGCFVISNDSFKFNFVNLLRITFDLITIILHRCFFQFYGFMICIFILDSLLM